MPSVNSDPDYKDKTFSQVLAEVANQDKTRLVAATIKAFTEGEPSAIKLVTQALVESRFKEEDNDLISDARFQEIICFIADSLRAPQA